MKKEYSQMSEEEVRDMAKSILNTSSSDEEVKRRFKEELGYPYESILIHSLERGNQRMSMARFYGPVGQIISI